MSSKFAHKMQKGYLPQISLLRITATVCVIWLHTCSTLAQNPDLFEMSDIQLKFFNSGYQMMNWAVPVFFMITGALLLNPQRHISVTSCLKKYCSRIVLAILLFGIPFAVLKLVMETGEVTSILIPLSLKAALENNSLSHLWYLYTLLGLYLILPFLRLFVRYASDSEVKLVIAALLTLDFVIPLFNALTGWEIAFDLPLNYPVFYCLVGWQLKRKTDEGTYADSKWFCAAMVLITVVFIWMMNFWGFNSAAWTDYHSPIIALLSAAVFVLFLSGFSGKERMRNHRVWEIDRLCFGAYLTHPVFIQFTYRFLKITPLRAGLYPLSAIVFSIVFTLCAFTASWLMNKIKPLRNYVL